MNERTIRLETTLNGEDGFIKRTNDRVNNHAWRIRSLEVAVGGAIAILAFIKFLLKG
jgi:hypothetical protein